MSSLIFNKDLLKHIVEIWENE